MGFLFGELEPRSPPMKKKKEKMLENESRA